MFKMGGLRTAIARRVLDVSDRQRSRWQALPLVTAGFYSKDLILWETWSSARGQLWLWTAGVGAR